MSGPIGEACGATVSEVHLRIIFAGAVVLLLLCVSAVILGIVIGDPVPAGIGAVAGAISTIAFAFVALIRRQRDALKAAREEIERLRQRVAELEGTEAAE